MVAVLLAIVFGVALVVAIKMPKPATAGTVRAPAGTTTAQNRGLTYTGSDMTDPRNFPHTWPLEGPLWLPTARPKLDAFAAQVASINWDEAFQKGYRLFPALADGTNQVTVAAKNASRNTWERGDEKALLGAAGILFALAEDSRAGSLQNALADGAATLDMTRLAVMGAMGARVGANDEFFRRLGAKMKAYDDRAKALNKKGREDFANLNWTAFAADVAEIGAFLTKSAYQGIQDAFAASHGGGPPINLRLGWTPREADEYAHRAYLAARRAS